MVITNSPCSSPEIPVMFGSACSGFFSCSSLIPLARGRLCLSQPSLHLPVWGDPMGQSSRVTGMGRWVVAVVCTSLCPTGETGLGSSPTQISKKLIQCTSTLWFPTAPCKPPIPVSSYSSDKNRLCSQLPPVIVGAALRVPQPASETALLTGLPSPAGSSVPSGAGGNITIYKSKLLSASWRTFPCTFPQPCSVGRAALWSQTFTTGWWYKHDCMSQTLQQHPVPVRQNPAMFCTWEIYSVWISWNWWFVSSLSLGKAHFAGK